MIERILTHLGLQARAPPRAPARGQMQHAEPGHKQSSGLFVPGEEAGHWPGAACQARDFGSTLPFRRPGARGRGVGLRQSPPGTGHRGLIVRVDPQTIPPIGP